MTKIYKNVVTNSLYKDLVTPPSATTTDTEINPMTVYVDVQPSYFEIKCSYLEEVIGANEDGSPMEPQYLPKVYFWHKVELSELMSKNSMCDNSMWTVRLDSLYSQYVALEDGTIGPISVNPLQIQDQFASTYINKGNFFDKANNGSSLYQIFVPFTEGADMTNFSYRIMVDGTQYGPVGKTLPFEFDPTSPAINDVQSEPVRPIDLISPITMTGPSTANADSSITVNFETTPGVSYIYLEQVHGMLPLVKVPVTNGTGSFKVLTLGMSSGDEIEVKAGFRKWNHVSSYTKTIS